MIYLACPYSHDDRAVRVRRFNLVNLAAAEMMKQGLKVFSPISHTHPIAEAGGLELGWDFWKEYDGEMVAVCKQLCVLTIDGWRESTGVQGELVIARDLHRPILQTEDGKTIERFRGFQC